MSGRSVPEPTRADREISAARGEPEPLRARLERKVRACAAAARSEAHFIALARAHGLLLRPRYDPGERPRVTGYAVAEGDGRTGAHGPIWIGGGKLASNLALPRLRDRWQHDPATTTMEALAAWSASTSTAPGAARGPTKRPGTPSPVAGGSYDAGSVAGVLAAAATGIEGTHPGPLSRAARHMARAAQEQPGPVPAADALRTMAGTFLAITSAGTDTGALILVSEVALLAEACAARAATPAARREAQQATALVQASIAALTSAAIQQAASTLTTSTRGTARMGDEPAYEDEALRLLTQAGVLAARVARARLSGPGMASDAAGLRAGGYSEATRHDDLLRQLLGEQRWAAYQADPARIVVAAAITDGGRAGYDMPALLARVIQQRRWENDDHSPSQSVARVLHYRVTREMARTTAGTSRNATRPRAAAVTSRGSARGASYQLPAGRTSPRPASRPARQPAMPAPYEQRLRDLLGEGRWRAYAEDPRQHDVAGLVRRAHHEGRNVDALLTAAVTGRPFEDDPVSPARNVADVLHYRLQRELSRQDDQGAARTASPGRRPARPRHGPGRHQAA